MLVERHDEKLNFQGERAPDPLDHGELNTLVKTPCCIVPLRPTLQQKFSYATAFNIKTDLETGISSMIIMCASVTDISKYKTEMTKQLIFL